MLKRILDIAVVSPLLVLISPVIALSALAIRMRMGSPVLFVQERPGLKGSPFRLFKLRSMTSLPRHGQGCVSDEFRITALGAALRRTSIDELPELWNVLTGDMSLVGPRPLLTEYLVVYSSEQARRHDVRPGITGIAQVLDRNDTTWERRLELDVWYVDNQSVWLDLRILAMTVGKVLSRSGIHAEGEATMSKFASEHSQ